jgi:hypothetical protein
VWKRHAVAFTFLALPVERFLLLMQLNCLEYGVRPESPVRSLRLRLRVFRSVAVEARDIQFEFRSPCLLNERVGLEVEYEPHDWLASVGAWHMERSGISFVKAWICYMIKFQSHASKVLSLHFHYASHCGQSFFSTLANVSKLPRSNLPHQIHQQELAESIICLGT